MTRIISDEEILELFKSGEIHEESINCARLDVMKKKYPKSYQFVINERKKNG